MKSEIINSELISVLLVGSSCIQSIYITNYRIGYYLDVKLADLIGCDIILILRGTKSKNI